MFSTSVARAIFVAIALLLALSWSAHAGTERSEEANKVSVGCPASRVGSPPQARPSVAERVAGFYLDLWQ
jgi:hypothetical protein